MSSEEFDLTKDYIGKKMKEMKVDKRRKKFEDKEWRKMKEVYLQCGYEDKCKKRDCLNCPRKNWSKINLTQAELITIEDFAVCDLDKMKKYHLRERNLMQKIMFQIMKKHFKVERKNENRRNTKEN